MSSKKIKPFDTNLEPTMSNLANGRINLKFKTSVLKLKRFSSLYSDFNLNIYLVYELSNWPHFKLKNYLFGTVKLVRNAIKSKFMYNG